MAGSGVSRPSRGCSGKIKLQRVGPRALPDFFIDQEAPHE